MGGFIVSDDDNYCYDDDGDDGGSSGDSFDYYDRDHDGDRGDGLDEGAYDDCDGAGTGSLGGFEAEDDDETSQSGRGASIKVITKDSLLAAQSEVLHQVMEMLSLKECHARTLLIHHRWDLDNVFSVFVEDGREKLCAEAGVPIVEQEDVPLSHIPSSVFCNICFEDFSADDITTMDCGHSFCNDCWTEHFIVKINEGQSRRIKCMHYKCNAICDEAKIRRLVSSRNFGLAEKFDRFLLESYVEDNRWVKWCPSIPHCGNAIRVDGDELFEVECACGLQFCFSCTSEVHSPCPCEMWELWSKKCLDESETVNWLTVNTKPCPKCRKPVEKNGGCNLVMCVCKQPFCWLCGGATGVAHTWNRIEGHNCGRYNDEGSKKLELAARHLNRYIHYHSRYKAHADSSKLEAELKEKLQEKINFIESRHAIEGDFSWVTNGLLRLLKYRRVLSSSYVLAFYIFEDNVFQGEMSKEQRVIKQNLFEDQQQQFEANIERLSMALSEDFQGYENDDLSHYRMKVIAFSKATDTLCRNLYEYIESDLLACVAGGAYRIAPCIIASQ